MLGVGLAFTQTAAPTEEPSATGAIVSSIGAASTAAAGTHAPAITGTVASSIGAPVSAATGTHAPAVTGTVVSSIGPSVSAASGAHAPAVTGTIASSIGPGVSAATGTFTSPPAEDLALAAVVAGFSSAPDSTRQDAMKALILALMTTDADATVPGVKIWDVCDRFYVFRNTEDQGGRVNWRNPGTGDATKNGTPGPAFTADVGFINVSGNDVATGFIPSTHGVYFTRNSNSFLCSTSVDVNDVASGVLAGNTQFSVQPRTNGGTIQTRNSSTGTDTGASNTGVGLYGSCRNNSANYIPYKGATAQTTVTRASSTLAATAVFLGSTAQSAYSTKPCGTLFIGGYLDATAMSAFNTAWNAYVAAL